MPGGHSRFPQLSMADAPTSADLEVPRSPRMTMRVFNRAQLRSEAALDPFHSKVIVAPRRLRPRLKLKALGAWTCTPFLNELGLLI